MYEFSIQVLKECVNNWDYGKKAIYSAKLFAS